jgi:hypothetical protein
VSQPRGSHSEFSQLWKLEILQIKKLHISVANDECQHCLVSKLSTFTNKIMQSVWYFYFESSRILSQVTGHPGWSFA